MTREEYIDFANALKNNYTIDFDKLPEFCDMAISALSENKGEWEKIWRTDNFCSEYVCSKCGCGEDYCTEFCPNCGADMREVKE